MASLEVGSVVADRYRLDRVLGEGGMGVVYAATHTRTRKLVAIKVLRPAMAADQGTRQRFLREARASCAVHHANVVEIHDVIELSDGTPMMVMELLEGESLASRLKREGVVPVGDLATLMLPVVSAVGTAHQVGIVHRDLKPDNIFLDRRRGALDVRVLDFGIAKLTATEGDAASSAAITGTGAVLGTPYYMSPEQVFGEKDIDHRADIWALGVILYECLAGARPTQADNIGQVFKIVMTDAIRPIEKVVPDLPSSLVRLIGRMLSRDRNGRPRDLREVGDVLAEYAGVQAPVFGEPAAPVVRSSGAGDASKAATPDRVVATPPEATSAGEFDDTVEQHAKPDGRASTQSPITVSQHGQVRSRSRRNRLPLVVGAAAVALAGASGALVWRGFSLPAPQQPKSAIAPEGVTTAAVETAATSAAASQEPAPPAVSSAAPPQPLSSVVAHPRREPPVHRAATTAAATAPSEPATVTKAPAIASAPPAQPVPTQQPAPKPVDPASYQ